MGAKQKAIHIFYISNRDSASIGATLINLKHARFPDAYSVHLLFKTNTILKKNRRQLVMKKYNVVMLLGENLADFNFVFEHTTIDQHFAETDSAREEWGRNLMCCPTDVWRLGKRVLQLSLRYKRSAKTNETVGFIERFLL